MPKKKVTEAVEETAQETIPVEKAPAQMPRRQGSEDLLELNDLERGVTREDIIAISTWQFERLTAFCGVTRRVIAWRLSSSFYLEALLNYFRTKLEVLLNCICIP